MKNKTFTKGIILLAFFGLVTLLVLTVDVRSQGVQGTDIGFAALNLWFHRCTGVHMTFYTITDWLGLVPVLVCMGMGTLGFAQLVVRKNLLKVDPDIVILGIYYIIVIAAYLIFEMIPINYRPILIEGVMEASYPSSTTLLVLCVMPTLVYQAEKRLQNRKAVKFIKLVTIVFSVFMVVGRLISGVHWITDIAGAIILSGGLFFVYKGITEIIDSKERNTKVWNWEKNLQNSEKQEE